MEKIEAIPGQAESSAHIVYMITDGETGIMLAFHIICHDFGKRQGCEDVGECKSRC